MHCLPRKGAPARARLPCIWPSAPVVKARPWLRSTSIHKPERRHAARGEQGATSPLWSRKCKSFHVFLAEACKQGDDLMVIGRAGRSDVTTAHVIEAADLAESSDDLFEVVRSDDGLETPACHSPIALDRGFEREFRKHAAAIIRDAANPCASGRWRMDRGWTIGGADAYRRPASWWR